MLIVLQIFNNRLLAAVWDVLELKVIWIHVMLIGELCLDLTALTFWTVCISKLTRKAILSVLKKWRTITLFMYSDCNIVIAEFLTLLFFHLFFFSKEWLKISCLLEAKKHRAQISLTWQLTSLGKGLASGDFVSGACLPI